MACRAVSWTEAERSEHRLDPASPVATNHQLVCFRTRRSSAISPAVNEQLLATQLLTETMQGVMPTGDSPRTGDALGGTASAPVAALNPAATASGLPEAPHPPLSVAQGPILPPSLYAAPTVPSAPGGSGCDAGSSTDPPPRPVGTLCGEAPAEGSACPAAGRAADNSSSMSSRAGGSLDASGLSIHLRSLLQAQVDALQPLVHASQQVATSFARDLAPLMQMQPPSLPAAAAAQPPGPSSALQALQGEMPMPPALLLLQELQQLEAPPQVPSNLLFRSLPSFPAIPSSSSGGDYASLHSLQPFLSPALLSEPSPAGAPCGPQLSSSTPITSVAFQGVTAAIPVDATPAVNPPQPIPYAYGSGDGGKRDAEMANESAPAAAQDPTDRSEKKERRQ